MKIRKIDGWLLAVAVFLLAVLPNLLWAAEQAGKVDGRGKIDSRGKITVLVANRAQGIYLKRVLVAAALPDGMHVGLILNNPTDIRILPENAADKDAKTGPAIRVYFGGPQLSEKLTAVVGARADKTGDPPGKGVILLTNTLFWAVGPEEVQEAIDASAIREQTRLFAGFVLWRAGELENEVRGRVWDVLDADILNNPENLQKIVLPKDTTRLWEELHRQVEMWGNSI